MRSGVALALAVSLCGCATTNGGDAVMGWQDNFGEANRQTMAAQIIDPHPVYPDAQAPAGGEHAAQAVARYRTDKVKKPERTTTSNTGGSGGSGAGNPQQ